MYGYPSKDRKTPSLPLVERERKEKGKIIKVILKPGHRCRPHQGMIVSRLIGLNYPASSGIDNGTLGIGDRSSFVVGDCTAALVVAGISGCLIPYMG